MENIDRSKVLKTEFGFQVNYNIDNKEYIVQLIYPQKSSNYVIPYLLILPKEMNDNCALAV